MTTSEELMQRLAVSKKIMEKHNDLKRGDSVNLNNAPQLESFNTPQATYNVPQEYLSESQETQRRPNFDPTKPIEETRILNSKLPDEIKRLMIEQPIIQPDSSSNATISNEIIEGAQRLMKMGNKNSQQPTNTNTNQVKPQTKSQNTQLPFNINEMKTIIRDIVRDTVRSVIREELTDAGVISESSEDANETIQFKVGKHIFLGRVTKIQKIK
jgi:molybdopterin-binding protein